MKVITLASSKSGMGGTTIAVTLASVLKEKNGLKTAVLEISSGAFDAPLYCGIKIKQEEAVMPVKFSDGTGEIGRASCRERVC